MVEAWQEWAKKPECEGTLVRRAQNELDQMESTKQLVRLIRPHYKPGMRILDVGCNVGHYYRGIMDIDPNVSYTGVDAYEHYINQAKRIYSTYPTAQFFVKDIFNPLFPDTPHDITYCCNVILHLPDFRGPFKNILNSTKVACFIRTLVAENNTIVKFAQSDELDDRGEPTRFVYQNSYSESTLRNYVNNLGWNVEFIDDEFDPTVLSSEHVKLKSGGGTYILNGKQVSGNVLFNWKFLKITPLCLKS